MRVVIALTHGRPLGGQDLSYVVMNPVSSSRVDGAPASSDNMPSTNPSALNVHAMTPVDEQVQAFRLR